MTKPEMLANESEHHLNESIEVLREQKEQYQWLINLTPDMIVVVADSVIAFINPEGARILGTDNPDDIVGKHYHQFVHPDDVGMTEQRITEALATGQATDLVGSRVIRMDGSVVEVEMRSVPTTYNGNPAMLAVIRDVHEKRQAQRLVREMAYTDSLTGLMNRRSFQRELQNQIELAKLAQQDVALMYLDMDNFKLINDSFGHTAGDELLRELAERITSVLPEGASIARLGGDEFTIFVPGLDTAADADRLAEMIVSSVTKGFFFVDGYEVISTISLGLATMDGRDVDDSELLREADVAMYEAKALGGNCAVRFRPELGDSLRIIRRLELQRGLHEAIEAGQLYLVYQPKFDVESHRVIGIEALVRWQSPEFGAVSPAEFIPVAEDSGMILQLGLWVFESVCRDVLRWHEQGIPPIRVAINLSARHFLESTFVGNVHDILHKYGLDGSLFEFEITERVLMQSNRQTEERLHALKQMGIQFAIDDFGTGYSSLGYLKKFEIDTLKIDQSFVRDLTFDPDSDEIVYAIIHLAHSLKLQVVAEGVESQVQHDVLRDYGCDVLQGFFLARPMPFEEMTNLLLVK